MHVRILQTPPGEAPLDIREAWVGLVLPLRPGESGQRQLMTQGVLTGPRTFTGWLFAHVLGRFKKVDGFCVDAAGAIQVLAKHDTRAADWWQTHFAAGVQPGRALIFHAEACQLVESPPTTAVMEPQDDANPGGPYMSDLN
jgi:hypothetical protein